MESSRPHMTRPVVAARTLERCIYALRDGGSTRGTVFPALPHSSAAGTSNRTPTDYDVLHRQLSRSPSAHQLHNRRRRRRCALWWYREPSRERMAAQPLRYSSGAPARRSRSGAHRWSRDRDRLGRFAAGGRPYAGGRVRSYVESSAPLTRRPARTLWSTPEAPFAREAVLIELAARDRLRNRTLSTRSEFLCGVGGRVRNAGPNAKRRASLSGTALGLSLFLVCFVPRSVSVRDLSVSRRCDELGARPLSRLGECFVGAVSPLVFVATGAGAGGRTSTWRLWARSASGGSWTCPCERGATGRRPSGSPGCPSRLEASFRP